MNYHMMTEQEQTLWIAVYAAKSGTDLPFEQIPAVADDAVLIFRARLKNGIEVKNK